ncbi:MAG: hypothetical protein ACKOER_05210 [Betaproteobacteria bacterium]
MEQVRLIPCADHPDFHSTVRAYLDSVSAPPIEHAAVAMASAVKSLTTSSVCSDRRNRSSSMENCQW